MTDTDHKINKQRAPRTSKACDYCKQKKVKCDGANPCSRCQKLMNNCEYTHVEKPKPLNRQRSSRKSAMKTLDSRIGKLEYLLTTLVNRIGDKTSGAGANNNNLSDKSEGSETSQDKNITDSEDAVTDSDDSTSSSPLLNSSNSNSGNNIETGHHIDVNTRACGEYVGLQCSLSIFSAPGLSWVSQKARNPNTIKPILYMIKEMDSVIGTQRDNLSVPIHAEDLVELPSKEECYSLLENYDKVSVYTSYIISRDEMKCIVHRYFSINEGKQGLKPLNYAELLCLYLMVGCGACYMAEQSVLKNLDQDVIKYQKLEHQYIHCAFYYFQRISIFGEGIPGLKAILLLACYAETSLIPELDFILTSSAVRFAQSLGLHRKESLLNRPPQEVTMRKRLWFLCYILDRDLCLKSGKPPMIHDEDISSIDTDGMTLFLHNMKLSTSSRMGINVNELDLNNLDHCDEIYETLDHSCSDTNVTIVEYTWLELAKITSKAYCTLFSANAFSDQSRLNTLKKIGALNNDLEELRQKLPISIRPGHPIRIPLSSKNYNVDFLKIVKMQLSFHLIVLVINRMALRKHWDERVKEQMPENMPQGEDLNEEIMMESKFTKSCMEACQEIMKVCNSISKSNFNFWISSAFILFSAYVTCLTFGIENPKEAMTKPIIEDMLHTLLDIHQQSTFPLNRIDVINFVKINGMNFALSILTKIAFELYNEQNSQSSILQKYLEQLDQRIISLNNILVGCIKDYKEQRSSTGPLYADKLSVTLSSCSIRDVIFKLKLVDPSSSAGSTPSTLTTNTSTSPGYINGSSAWRYHPNGVTDIGTNIGGSTTTTSSSSSSSKSSGPHFPSHGRELLLKPGHKQYEEGLSTTNSLGDDGTKSNLLAGYNGGINGFEISEQQQEQPTKVPSVEEVLDTSDLNINWNYFSHNLFNIPVVSFMDDLNNVGFN